MFVARVSGSCVECERLSVPALYRVDRYSLPAPEGLCADHRVSMGYFCSINISLGSVSSSYSTYPKKSSLDPLPVTYGEIQSMKFWIS